LESPEVEVVLGDLADGAALKQLTAGADVVIHVAGRVAARDEAEFLRSNRDGTARLATAARDAGVSRLVYVSSLAATGPTLPGRPVDETALPRPVTPYGRSKLAGEEAVRNAGVSFTIVRPPTVYGPRDRELLRVFRLCRYGLAPLLGDGRQELSLIHAADLAQALLAATHSATAAGRVYHAAHKETLTQRALIEAIGRAVRRRVRTITVSAPAVRAILHLTGAAARLAGRATLLAPDKAPELLAPAWTCSSAALERDTGWRAEIGFEQGASDTARWYREQGWL
jgi:nucleoside-diphosphate-sugar epimerase